ncbi:MAG: ATP-binding cassette domain-containing protein, partial [Treponema sp.]|nr:ATP-binding cassette domain-containing protein [Treponema sp.]
LVTFNMYVASVQSPIRKLTQFTEQFTQGMAGFQRFRAIMHEEPDVTDAPDAQPLTDVRGDIAFNDVTFTYDQNKDEVLEHVNLHIRPGEMLALVGPSGGGKSTLCQLIPRFYEVTSGSVTIDGHDVRHVKLADLRGSIGIVQQDVFLFAGTILDNIRYGRRDATMEEVIEAAKLAEIHEDILHMPDGYNTLVGERGVMLSGGQKQRVSIARIFLKNPRVLILDEATSALDTATERKIQAAFDRLARGRTTLVIAHRLSTIRNADEIVVIGEHGILERGTHRELVAQGGVYAELAAGASLCGE